MPAVVGVELVCQPRTDRAQQPVADVVAERVVDLLEPVQVQDEQRDAVAVAAGAQGRFQLGVGRQPSSAKTPTIMTNSSRSATG